MIEDKSSAFIGEAFDHVLKTYFQSNSLDKDFLEEDGYYRSYSGYKNPSHNIFYQDMIQDRELDSIISETVDYFTRKGVPFTWWVSDETINNNVRKALKNAKFRYFGDIRGLSINLTDLKKNFDTPNALYTEELVEKTKMKEWTRIAAPTFGMRNDKTKELDDKLEEVAERNANLNIRRYMSFLSGDPVSVSTQIESMGVAGIMDDEIIPYYGKYDPFRMAVIYYPLIEAKKRGLKVGIGFADNKRINFYKMLGFDESYQYYKFVYVPKKR